MVRYRSLQESIVHLRTRVLFHAVSSVHAANCDKLALRLNGRLTRKTEFSLSEKQNTKIRCYCDDETQVVKWYYNNSTSEVMPQDGNEQVFTRERDEPLTGTILTISRDASPLDYGWLPLPEY